MSILGKLFKKKPEEKPKEERHEAKPEVKPEYAENICAVCGQPGADKKFAGQWFHKKCLRKARKMAKSML